MQGATNLTLQKNMLVLSKSGYLTEVEIKRSWNDFLADFKKKHNHNNYQIIKYFYYCVPESLYEKTRDYKFQGAGLFGGIHSNTSQIQGSNCRVLTTSSHLNNQFSISTSWQFFIQ